MSTENAKHCKSGRIAAARRILGKDLSRVQQNNIAGRQVLTALAFPERPFSDAIDHERDEALVLIDGEGGHHYLRVDGNRVTARREAGETVETVDLQQIHHTAPQWIRRQGSKYGVEELVASEDWVMERDR